MMHAHPRCEFFDDFCALRGLAFHQDPTLAGEPIIVISLRERSFGFVDVALSSVWYDLTRVANHTVQLRGNEDLPQRSRERATGDQEIDLSRVARHPLALLHEYPQLFWESRREGKSPRKS